MFSVGRPITVNALPVPSGVNLRLAASAIAQADGSAVTTWSDSSSNAKHFTDLASGPGANLWLTGANVPFVQIGGTQLGNASYSTNLQAASFLIVLQFQAVSGTAYILNIGAALDAILQLGSAFLTMFHSGDTTFRPSNGRVAILVTLGPSAVKVYLDSVSNVQSLPAYGAGSVTGIRLSGSGALLGNVYDVVGWNRELNTAEVADVLNGWASPVYGVGADAKVPSGRVIFEGDSLFFGINATKSRSLPYYMGVNPPWLAYNYAVGGSTWPSLISREAIAFNFANSTNWLIPYSGVNDVNGGTPATTIQANFATYMTDAVAAGFTKPHIVAFTTAVQETGGQLTERNSYNTWLRANYTTYAGWLVDLQADANLGSSAINGAPNDASYWSAGDTAHYNDKGYVSMAALIRSTVTGLPF